MSELIDKEDLHLILKCPHCEDYVLIEKLNCCIFRHGILKYNGKQMDPHANKIQCDLLIKNKEIFGCGKPFKIIITKNNLNVETYSTEICDYI
jgi:hypothetical protein